VQNIKSSVLSALQTATALSTLNGVYFFYPPNFIGLSASVTLSYFEVDNLPNLFADNQEIGSEIVYQIDLWSKISLSNYTLAVDAVMTGLDFARITAQDLYEKDNSIYHKAMRYRKDHSDPNF
jgi:hypothetical protein